MHNEFLADQQMRGNLNAGVPRAHGDGVCVTARVRIVSMGCLWTAKAHIKSSKLFQFKLVRVRP